MLTHYAASASDTEAFKQSLGIIPMAGSRSGERSHGLHRLDIRGEALGADQRSAIAVACLLPVLHKARDEQRDTNGCRDAGCPK